MDTAFPTLADCASLFLRLHVPAEQAEAAERSLNDLLFFARMCSDALPENPTIDLPF